MHIKISVKIFILNRMQVFGGFVRHSVILSLFGISMNGIPTDAVFIDSVSVVCRIQEGLFSLEFHARYNPKCFWEAQRDPGKI